MARGISVLVLVVAAVVIRWILHRLVDRLVSGSHGLIPNKIAGKLPEQRPGYASRREQRSKTLGSLLKSVITGIVFAVFGTMILSELGINIAPLLASAGILGLAIGFGAQSLVKDYVTGIFMVVEDQYGVGDVIDIAGTVGTVENVSLRVTRLRSLDGTVWYVPNGEILKVGNMSQNWACAVVEVGVAYGEDLVRVKQVLGEVAHDMWNDEEYRGIIIEEPEVTGVESLSAAGVTLRVLVKTAPMEQWAVAREMRQRIKGRFDFEGIEIPYPHRVIVNRNEPQRESAEAS